MHWQDDLALHFNVFWTLPEEVQYHFLLPVGGTMTVIPNQDVDVLRPGLVSNVKFREDWTMYSHPATATTANDNSGSSPYTVIRVLRLFRSNLMWILSTSLEAVISYVPESSIGLVVWGLELLWSLCSLGHFNNMQSSHSSYSSCFIAIQWNLSRRHGKTFNLLCSLPLFKNTIDNTYCITQKQVIQYKP